jgi:uncharacterized membrane protein
MMADNSSHENAMNVPEVIATASRHGWPYAAVKAALEYPGVRPSEADWRRAISQVGMLLAAASLGLALVFWVAYNWQSMTRLTKFGLIQSLLVVCVALAVWQAKSQALRAASLFAALLVLGALLAFTGQTYQTGADTWELFAAWTALGLLFAAASAHALPWSLLLATANLAYGLYWSIETRLGWGVEDWRWPLLLGSLGNLAVLAIAVWARQAIAGAPVLMAVATGFAYTVVTFAVVATVVGDRIGWLWASYWLIYGASLGVGTGLGWMWARQPVLLALAAISVFAVVTTQGVRWLFLGVDNIFAFLLAGVYVIGVAAVLAWAVRRMMERDVKQAKGAP